MRSLRNTMTALTLALLLGLTGCGGGSGSGTSAPANTADIEFAQGMIPHHQQAVELSDTVLAKTGVSEETAALARQITAAQQPEIATMQGWLKAWGQSEHADMEGMDHHSGTDSGMATEPQLTALQQADGKQAEKLYLELMTAHHRGAVTMAQTEIDGGAYAEAVTLARGVASSQQAEIDTMAKLLAAL